MATKPTRAIGYARVSSAEQALGSSLQDQQDVIRAEALRRGVPLARIYVEAESGIRAKEERREQMAALLRDIRKGDLVLVDKIDRWSRDTEGTLRSVRVIEEAGATWYAINERCDPHADGRFMLTMWAGMAANEHTRIKVRTVGTRKHLRNAGLYSEGKVPLGYVRTLPKGTKGADKNVLVIEPEGAKIVRKVFALCIVGHSISQVARAVGMNRNRAYSIMCARTYVGEIQNTDGQWIKARHEPIIDKDTYLRATAALEARSYGSAKPRETPSETSTWILRDVARCVCGGRMSATYAGPKDERRRYYYRCFHKCGAAYVPVRSMEKETEPLIVARLGELRHLFAREPDAVKAAPVGTDAKRAKLATKRDRLIDSFSDGLISKEELRAKLTGVDDALLKLDAEDGEAARPSRFVDPKVRKRMLLSMEKIAKSWARAPAERRRQIVNVIATAMHLGAGQPARPIWRETEDFAVEVT